MKEVTSAALDYGCALVSSCPETHDFWNDRLYMNPFHSIQIVRNEGSNIGDLSLWVRPKS